MSDPFIHHPSDDLEASTVITNVSEDALNHAASEAARQVTAASSTKPQQKGGRRGKVLAVSAPPLVTSEPGLIPPEVQSPVMEGLIDTSVEAVILEAETPPADIRSEAAPAAEASTPLYEAAADPVAVDMEGVAETADPVVDALATGPEAPAEPLAAFSEDAAAVSPVVVETTTDLVESMSDAVPTVVGEAAAAQVFTTAEVPQAADVMGELRIRVVQAVQHNMESSVSLWTSLLQAKSASEAIEVNTTHLRRQMESFVSQSLELSRLARRAATLSMTGAFGRLSD